MAQKVQIPPDLIGGDVDEGYGKVADAFRRNLSSGREIGAAIAVYRDGRKVVDLWGGYRNGITRAPWEQDTLVNVFSTTKGIASLAVAVAASKGYLSYDAKVTDYWPEFAQAGKETVTVRQLLAHQAGLPVVKPPLTLQELADPPRMSAKLAAQVPAWTPGTRHGYHGITLGWYEGELIRRTDPAGRSLGRFFAEEIARPLGLDLYIGLPPSIDRDRVAYLHAWSFARLLLHLNTMPPRFVLDLFNPFGLAAPSLLFAEGIKSPEAFNRDELRVVEMPAVNGTGTARSIAKLYGSAATGGPRARFDRRHPRRAAQTCAATDQRTARQGAARRYDVLAGLQQAHPRVSSSVPPTMPLERRERAARSDSPIQTPASDTAT